MSKGDGSIIEAKKPDGTSYNPKHWKIRLDLGKDPVTGKRRVKSRTVEGTKTYARKVRDDMRRELEQGIKPDADKMTFRDMCNMYTKSRDAAGYPSEKRRKLDKRRLELVCEIAGDIPLNRIDVRVITDLIPAIRERRIEQGYSCGNTTLHAYFAIIKAVLKQAVNYGFMVRNPCELVKPPKKDPIERKSLSESEAQRLLECLDCAEDEAILSLKEKEARQKAWGVDTDRSYLLGMRDVCYCLTVRIGLATGMRLGEIFNLTWGDLSGNVITIHRAKTKTDAGTRSIAIDRDTLNHLQAWKRYQADLLASIHVAQSDRTPILCNATGKALDVPNFEHWWGLWRCENGFPGLLFHELRHTQATLLLGSGMDIKTVQTRLGHSDPALTLKFYAHAMPDNDQAASDLIAEITRGKKKARIIPLRTA